MSCLSIQRRLIAQLSHFDFVTYLSEIFPSHGHSVIHVIYTIRSRSSQYSDMERKNSSPQPSTGTATAPKLAFGFSKKLAQPKVLEASAISDPSTFQTKEETDYVLEVNEAGVKGTLVQAGKKGPLVIPCNSTESICRQM